MIIETRNLTKKFGTHDAVSGISLSVPEGATVALIGANGAGKTTTLRMLMNLLEAARRGAGAGRRQPAPHRARIFPHRLCVGKPEAACQLTTEQFFAYLRPLMPPGIAPSKATCAAASSCSLVRSSATCRTACR